MSLLSERHWLKEPTAQITFTFLHHGDSTVFCSFQIRNLPDAPEIKSWFKISWAVNSRFSKEKQDTLQSQITK